MIKLVSHVKGNTITNQKLTENGNSKKDIVLTISDIKLVKEEIEKKLNITFNK